MKTLELESFGLSPLSFEEASNIDGGDLWSFAAEYVLGKVVDAVVGGFIDACKNGYTQDSGFRAMNGALG